MVEDILLRKYNELWESDSNILVLKPKFCALFDVVQFNRRYKDARATMTRYGEQFIFIRKIKHINGDIGSIMEEAKKAFYQRNDVKAIQLYEMLLSLKKVPDFVFARLGLLYLRQSDLYKAIPFLNIATGINRKTDFSDLVNKILKKEVLQEEREVKPNVMMNVEEFRNDLNDYGNCRVKDVSILMEFHGLSLDDACFGLNVLAEEKNMIALFLTRDCYARGDFSLGDKYLRLVESSPVKTEEVRRLLNEIRVNKKFYKNRVDENFQPLLRTRAFK